MAHETSYLSPRVPETFGSAQAVSFLLTIVLFCLFYFLLGCSVGSSTGATGPANAAQAALGTGVVDAQFFGMVVKSPSATPAVAVGSRRL